jgi:hypothetical protein
VEFFVKSLREHQEDPRGSIEDMGKAFEDFVRRLGTEKGIDMSKCNGIGQCAQVLKANNLIVQKHLEICQHVNAFRLAAAHSKEKDTLESWYINPDAAIEAILTALTAIRSIFTYVFSSQRCL